MDELGGQFLGSARAEFAALKKLAERTLAQVDDQALHRRLDPESNSLAVLIQHLSGNLRSRWTDFLTSDGEKPDRRRDAEFEEPEPQSRAALLERWERGWLCLFETLDALRPEDLSRTVTVRAQPLGVVEAIHKQLVHYGQHVGQMAFLAKHLLGPGWKTLSVPRARPSRSSP